MLLTHENYLRGWGDFDVITTQRAGEWLDACAGLVDTWAGRRQVKRSVLIDALSEAVRKPQTFGLRDKENAALHVLRALTRSTHPSFAAFVASHLVKERKDVRTMAFRALQKMSNHNPQAIGELGRALTHFDSEISVKGPSKRSATAGSSGPSPERPPQSSCEWRSRTCQAPTSGREPGTSRSCSALVYTNSASENCLLLSSSKMLSISRSMSVSRCRR